jgi:hypothetical protein
MQTYTIKSYPIFSIILIVGPNIHVILNYKNTLSHNKNAVIANKTSILNVLVYISYIMLYTYTTSFISGKSISY